jgi:hypothetical protein
MFQIKKTNAIAFLFVFEPSLNLTFKCYISDLKEKVIF